MSITPTKHKPLKIIIGLSGGVDSSVSALLLKEQGYEVEAVFMKNWEEDDTDTYCSASVDIEDAQRVCDKLQIPFHTVNFAAEYWDRVFEHFLREYQAGRTPNPDILCNKEIKFNAFLDFALQLGADKIATGHYVRSREKDGSVELLKAKDPNKDQSYFLHALSQAPLRKSIFPIGEIPKPEVRKIAENAGLITHDKKDSTGICFIGERKFKNFLEKYLPAQPGVIENLAGKKIGTHSGLMYYTLGQRQGLGIGGKKNASEDAWYVIGKDLERNVLIVDQGHDHPALFSNKLICTEVNWISGKPPELPYSCKAKTRYRQQETPCKIVYIDENHYQVTFEQAQRAITPGQSVVFYTDEVCLGGGIIKNSGACDQVFLD